MKRLTSSSSPSTGTACSPTRKSPPRKIHIKPAPAPTPQSNNGLHPELQGEFDPIDCILVAPAPDESRSYHQSIASQQHKHALAPPGYHYQQNKIALSPGILKLPRICTNLPMLMLICLPIVLPNAQAMPIIANVQETTTTAATVHTNSERKNAANLQGMSIKLPQDLVKLIETEFMNSRMPQLHLVHHWMIRLNFLQVSFSTVRRKIVQKRVNSNENIPDVSGMCLLLVWGENISVI
jgi:hypothetical protein